MGYTTWFKGKFRFNKKIDDKLYKYLTNFNNTRHMKRDINRIIEMYPDWKKYSFNGDLGNEGAFFAPPYDREYYLDESVIDINNPPIDVPGIWCQWKVSDDKRCLEWDRGEKFYHYIEWLSYLIKNFIEPSGYRLNGKVDWQGENDDDKGTIIVQENVIKAYNVSD